MRGKTSHSFFCMQTYFPTPLSACMLVPQPDLPFLPFLLSPISSPGFYYQGSVQMPFLQQDSLFHKLESIPPSPNMHSVFKFLVTLVTLFSMRLHKDKNTDWQSTPVQHMWAYRAQRPLLTDSVLPLPPAQETKATVLYKKWPLTGPGQVPSPRIYLENHSLIQKMLLRWWLYARHCSRHWKDGWKENKVPVPMEFTIWGR